MTRFEPPAWKPAPYSSAADDYGGAFYAARLMILFVVIEIPLFIVLCLVVPLLRFVVLMPWTIVRGLRSQRLRVEAVTFYPWHESHLWFTNRDHVDEVVRQVARGFTMGDVAQPLGADFRGSRQLVGGTFRGLARDD